MTCVWSDRHSKAGKNIQHRILILTVIVNFLFPVSTLYEACAHAIVNRTSVYGIDRLPLPDSVKQNLKSYALTNYSGPGGRPAFMGAGGGGGISGGLNRSSTPFYKSLKQSKKHNRQPLTPADAAKVNCTGGVSRKSCSIS